MEELGVAIVTGGAGDGIGGGISHVLARHGWRVLVADWDAVQTQKMVEQIQASGGQAHGVEIDLTQSDAPARVVDAAMSWARRIDGLVNSAAISLPRPVEELSDDILDQMIDLNLRAMVRLVRQVGPVITQPGGSIVNIASVHALATVPGFTGYAATKGAVIAMSRAMAADFGRRGIRVNCILPGLVDSAMSRRLVEESGGDVAASYQDWSQRRQLLPDMVRGREVGELAEFLLSQRSSGITGQSIAIDAGTLAMLIEREP